MLVDEPTISNFTNANHTHAATGVTGGTIANITGNAATVTGLSVVAGKTLTVNKSITLDGTDSTTMTFPSTSQTIAGLGVNQTFTTGQLITIADTVNKTGLTVTQNDTTNNLKAVIITQAANNYSLDISDSSTLTAGVRLTRNVATVAQSVGQEQRPILLIDDQNVNNHTESMHIKNASTDGTNLFISMSATKIDGDGTNVGLRIISDVAQTSSLSGWLISIAQSNVSSTQGSMFINDFSNGSNGALRVVTNGNQRGIYIYDQSNTDGLAGLYIDKHGHSQALYVTRSDASATNELVRLVQGSATDSNHVLQISNSGTGTDITANNFTLTNGAIIASSFNKLILTQPATGSTLTIIDGRTLTVNKTMSLTAADDTGVYTFPTGTKTLLATDGSIAGLTGTISSTVLGNSTIYIGTTAVALNRASAALVLTGITSIDGNAATVTNATLTTALTIDTGTVQITGNVANSSHLTLGAGASSVSGSNTGDQTNITGNAGTVTNGAYVNVANTFTLNQLIQYGLDGVVSMTIKNTSDTSNQVSALILDIAAGGHGKSARTSYLGTGYGWSVGTDDASGNFLISNSGTSTTVSKALTFTLSTVAATFVGTVQAAGYLASDGTAGLTQTSTATLGKSITLKNGLVTAFA